MGLPLRKPIEAQPGVLESGLAKQCQLLGAVMEMTVNWHSISKLLKASMQVS